MPTVPTIPWAQVREVVDAVLDLPPGERISYLDQACPQPAVRRYVESLVLSYDQAGNFLDEPAVVYESETLEHGGDDSWTGRRVGPYQVVEEVGHGGMGSVYRALRADDQYRKEVAIKIVRSGFDTRQALTRFRAERQILADLDHPNIARLLDGGTTEDGKPYFVMEYIEGQPLDRYCDDHRLNITERLRLFRTVCSAVQYAHQKLVIHRDLKPGNIMVSKDGVPKLLDFGIAKILGPESGAGRATQTMPMVRLLTPEYASPEQLRGETITTSSDVYSLGVVLYELLTGHRPGRASSRQPKDIKQTADTSEPERPSSAVSRVATPTHEDGEALAWNPETVSATRDGTLEQLRRRLSGDLDNIVLMALRKEPQRRYASVEQFAEDLRRHLEGLPVIARRDTFDYRSGKFIKRHSAAVAAAVLVVLGLTAGLVVTLKEANIARTQRARAERRFNDVRKLANSLMLDVHDSIRDLPGSTPARKLLVDRALEYLDSLAQESSGDQSLQRELAAAYARVGLVQGDTSSGSLGDSAGAFKSYQKELAIRQALESSPHATAEDRLELAISLSRIARLSFQMGDTSEALKLSQKSVEITEGLRNSDPYNVKVLTQLQSAYDALGDTLSSDALGGGGLGQLAQASAIHVKQVELGQAITKLYPNDVDSERSLAIALYKVGNDLVKTGQRTEALASYFRARDIFAKLATDHPTNARLRRSLAAVYSAIGDAQAWDGDLKGSLESYQKVLNMNRAAAAVDPKNEQAQIDLAVASDGVGYAQGVLGHLIEAQANLSAARDVAEKAAKADPRNSYAKDVFAYSEVFLGEFEQRRRAYASALASYRSALSIWEPLSTSAPDDVDHRLMVASAETKIGEIMAGTGHTGAAEAAYRKALAGVEPLASTSPPNEWALYAVADSTSGLGDAFSDLAERNPRISERTKEWNEARAWYQRSANTWRRVHNPAAQSPGHFDCGSPGHVTAALVRCDAALAKLLTRVPQ
jgi:eukaryotic-like serine/threonine-protein kinase